jgi:restriction system protein
MNKSKNSTSGGGSGIGYKFINREPELELLQQLFLIEDKPLAAITGSKGIGKTALAQAFYRRFARSFSGGMSVLDVRADSDVPRLSLQLEHERSTNQGSSLLVVGVNSLDVDSLAEDLNEALAVSPRPKILLESRRVIQSLPVGIQVNLENFTQSVTEAFIDSLGHKLDQPTLRSIYLQTLGHPRQTLLFLAELESTSLPDDQLTRALHTFDRPGLLDQYGRPLDSDSGPYKTIITDVESVNDDLLRSLSNNPRLLYELTPRGFENVVAELLRRLGYQVTVTPPSNDGGKDIYAAKKTSIGSFLYLVECKKYAPDNRVGVELIRQLHGVVQAEKATAGILVTTSFFTKGALEFQGKVSYQISLQDFVGVQKWLQSVVIDVA